MEGRCRTAYSCKTKMCDQVRITSREGHFIEGNVHIVIGKENYYLSADGLLMPAKKNQAPPDLRYFKQSQK